MVYYLGEKVVSLSSNRAEQRLPSSQFGVILYKPNQFVRDNTKEKPRELTVTVSAGVSIFISCCIITTLSFDSVLLNWVCIYLF